MKLNSSQKLYAMLVVCTAIPFLFNVPIPTKCSPSSVDFYQAVMAIPEGSTVLIQSDWTNSTRGESMGQMESLMKILMRHKVKSVIYSAADPQAPQVARDLINSINLDQKKHGEPEYKRWDDWVMLGFFPNPEGTGNAMASNLRKAFAGKKDTPPGGSPTDVFLSPPLKDIKSVGDAAMLINITASNTINILIERLSGRVKMGSMCTGVMGPETLTYYSSGQLSGVSVGLRGVVEMETMLQSGVNVQGPDGKIFVEQKGKPETAGFPGKQNLGRGMQYFLSLHIALILLIGAVIAGNLPLIKQRLEARRKS